MKKLFIISSSLLVLFLIFLLAYNIAFRKSPEAKTNSIVSGESEDEQNSSIYGKIKPVVDESVIGFFLDKKNEELFFYSSLDGKAWRTDLEGERRRNFSSEESIGLMDALWSPGGGKAIAVFSQGGWHKNFFLHEEGGTKITKLGAGTDTVAWDNLGAKIIYKYFDEDTKAQSINIANPDGSDWKKIADTRFTDVAIAPIPKTSLVSFWNKGKAQEPTELSVVGMNGGEAKIIFSGKTGVDYEWSPNGERAIVSHLKEQGNGSMTTGLIDINGSYVELGIPTMASKMEWSLDSKHVYYALPSIPDGAVMPDDYDSGKFKSTDTFWKINTQSGEKTRLIDLAEIKGAYDAGSLTLSPSEDALYFVNKVDGKIYTLDF